LVTYEYIHTNNLPNCLFYKVREKMLDSDKRNELFKYMTGIFNPDYAIGLSIK